MSALFRDAEWFEKNKKGLLDATKRGYGEEADTNDYLVVEKVDKLIELSDDLRELKITIETHPGLFISLDVPIDEDLLLKMMEVVIKRINKMRAAIEAVK